jgi:hypothetical protein
MRPPMNIDLLILQTAVRRKSDTREALLKSCQIGMPQQQRRQKSATLLAMPAADSRGLKRNGGGVI